MEWGFAISKRSPGLMPSFHIPSQSAAFPALEAVEEEVDGEERTRELLVFEALAVADGTLEATTLVVDGKEEAGALAEDADDDVPLIDADNEAAALAEDAGDDVPLIDADDEAVDELDA